MQVYDTRSLYSWHTSVRVGAQAVKEELRYLLKEHGSFVINEGDEGEPIDGDLSAPFLDDALLHCSASPTDEHTPGLKDIYITFNGGFMKLSGSFRESAFNSLFGPEFSIVDAISQCLLKVCIL
jgi:hypothetical protein